MTAAPAAPRARTSSLALVLAFAFAYACVALAVLAALATAANDASGADALVRGARALAAGRIETAFGPETAAAGADGGALGWLAAVALAALAASPLGSGASAAATAACALGGFVLLAFRVRAIASPHVALVALVLAVATSIDALRVGGPACTLLFGAALALALDTTTMLAPLAAGVVTVLWCNADATGVLAPVLAFANALGRVADRDDPRATRAAFVAALATGVALFATPELSRYPQLAIGALHLSGGGDDLVPWAPYAVAARAYRGGFTLLIGGALVLGLRSCGTRGVALAIVAIVLALANGNLLPIAAVFVVPVLAAAASARLARGAARVRATSGASFVVAALAVVAVASAFGFAARDRPALAPVASEPHDALRRLAARSAVRGVACVRVAWCDDAVGVGLRVLADGRLGAMPPAVHRAQYAIARAGRTWRHDADAARIDAIVVSTTSPLAALYRAQGWRALPGARTVAIYVRPGVRP